MGKTLAFIVALVCAGTANAATVTNGSFEIGDFTGWSTFGNASVVTTSGGISPTDGYHQAFITTKNGGDPNAWFTFVGQTAPQFNPFGNGSAISSTITAAAGQYIAWDWTWQTQEQQPVFEDDIATVFIDGNAVAGLSVGFTPTGFAATGSFQFTSDGTHTIAFGVRNRGDTVRNSMIYVDNVRVLDAAPAALIVPVPVPAALWPGLSLLGLCGAVIHRRRTPRTP